MTEFWSGWFDHWGEKHHIVKIQRIEKALKTILDRGASFNFYMFHGMSEFFEGVTKFRICYCQTHCLIGQKVSFGVLDWVHTIFAHFENIEKCAGSMV